MIKRILLWLTSIYFKPATADIKTPEVIAMSDIPVDLASQPATVQIIGADGKVNVQAAAGQSPATEAKTGVANLDAALHFIESGVAQLGEAAKDELKALAKKYL